MKNCTNGGATSLHSLLGGRFGQRSQEGAIVSDSKQVKTLPFV